MTLAKRLKELKGRKSLQKFGDQVKIGPSTLHNYTKGRDVPSRMLKKICIATGCDANWLLGLARDNEPRAEIRAAGYRMYLKAQIKEVEKLLKTLEV